MCENHIDIKRDITANESCNNCPNATCNVIKATNGSRYNWYCEIGKSMRMLELSCPANTNIQIPEWCPKLKEKASLTQSNKVAELLEAMPPMTKWEDIKVNQIYRIPPICGWDRMDIWIKSKNQYSCTYVVLKKGVNSSSAPIQYLYPSSKQAKFIVPHRNMKMEMKANK